MSTEELHCDELLCPIFPAVLQVSLDVPAPLSATYFIIPTCFAGANIILGVPEAVQSNIPTKGAQCPYNFDVSCTKPVSLMLHTSYIFAHVHSQLNTLLI